MATAHPILDAATTTAHNDRVLAQELRLRNWQLTTWWALALCIVLVAANCTQWLTRKEHYVPVLLDGVGVGRFLSEMTPTDAHTLPIKVLHVQRFIRGIRLISLDARYQEQEGNAAFFLCREKAQGFLRDYFTRPENDPKPLLKRGVSRLPVNIQVLPQTADTFAVSWDEDMTETTGMTRTAWTALVTLETKDPATLTATERQRSPFGIFITAVAWNPVQKERES